MPTSPASARDPLGRQGQVDPERLEHVGRARADEDAARLPCLTTCTPRRQTTIAAQVEMFTVWARSPPVPTMSRLGSATSMRTACASI